MFSLAHVILLAATALAQSSSSESTFSIQTSPPTPTSSISSASGSAAASGSSASASASASSSASAFPQQCGSQCGNISLALTQCNVGSALNTSCLCTVSVESSYAQCLECALSLTPTDTARSGYQALIDSYRAQCASATSAPVTLPNVTITLPSSSSNASTSSSNISTTTPAASSTAASSSSAKATSSIASASASASKAAAARGAWPGGILMSGSAMGGVGSLLVSSVGVGAALCLGGLALV
ncbi:hypothetical protein JCM24511_01445 [Saitozyma sp. JCM 24511]|nr:hypothetical protein JCM24511_01445 [Saitozyma sp. JCM 24511]